ncbi:MAG: hypothetical protein KJN63_03740, partial [Acidimicrobiia bacterium]|nr:hypothetical protein [Acidimicrobiia bacterium]
MSARCRTITGGIGAALVALVLAACSSPSPPGTLARADRVDSEAAADRAGAEILAPVTTASPPSATSTVPPATVSGSPPGDSADTTEQPPPSNMDRIIERLLTAVGPTDDLVQTVRSVAPFPDGVMTPTGADIIEVSFGTGSPAGDGTVLAQVAVSLTASLDTSVAFDQMTSSLRAAGMSSIDSTSEGDIRSAAFRVGTTNLFDEVVVTVAPNPAGSSVRLTSNSNVTPDQLQWVVDWAGEPLPLPDDDGRRTLVVVSAAGSGRLRVVNLTVETVAAVTSGEPQTEANRLISRLEGSSRIGFSGDPHVDQPLNGSLTFDELDSLEYLVVPSIRVEVNQD